MKRTLLFLASLLVLAGCGDPVNFSAPIGINLKAKAADAKDGVVSSEKGITSETGNPYGAFINDARGKLEGRDPARIEISSLTLLLGGQSTGVTSLEQVFAGQVDAFFVMNETDNSYPVGKIKDPTGNGPVEFSVSFDSDTISGVDRSKLLGGDFKATLRGPAAAGFTPPSTAEANLQLTFTFEAFE
ncbi:MAG: hypothetical protein JXB05_35225 [Myxococcaceae bacterium]|nr:hypothetical protein [Myxococcaceae bacterium]